jgi:NTE family protein
VRTALVLGAGGLTGQAFHLGVLRALEDLTGFDGRRADVVVGTSAGSLVAAGLAGGISATDQAAALTGEPMSPDARTLLSASRARAAQLADDGDPSPQPAGLRPLAASAVLAAARRPWAVRPGALASSLLPAGRNTSHGVSRGVQQLHGERWPDRGLRVCAVRARDARRVVFGTSEAPQVDVGTAVAASCAIPAYFAPVWIHGDAYVDGGAHSPTNADVIVDDAPELVVISSPMSFGPGRTARTADAVVRMAARRYLAHEVRRLRRRGATVVVFQPSPDDLTAMGLNPLRLLRVPRVLRTASASARARLEAQPGLVDLLARA